MILDSKISYENHLQSVFSRAKKTIGLLRKFQPTLPRKYLVTIYKSFIRPHLDYGDVVYERASNKSFHQSLESLQSWNYNTNSKNIFFKIWEKANLHNGDSPYADSHNPGSSYDDSIMPIFVMQTLIMSILVMPIL